MPIGFLKRPLDPADLVATSLVTAIAGAVGWYLRSALQSKRALPEGESKEKAEAAALPSPRQTLALLRKRRSVFPKDYGGTDCPQVTEAVVRSVLAGAVWAPTHKRTEPWRFVVVRGDQRKRVWEATAAANRAASEAQRGESFESFSEWFAEDVEKEWSKCDCWVAICLHRSHPKSKKLPEWEEVAAVASAVQNLHLMATAHGIAGYWSSWNTIGRDSPQMHTLLGLERARGDRCLGFFLLAASDRISKVRPGKRDEGNVGFLGAGDVPGMEWPGRDDYQ